MANLFLHYAFDAYMARKFPDVRFERYVDDLVVHARSERQAQMLRRAIDQRFAQVGLRMHPNTGNLEVTAVGSVGAESWSGEGPVG